jgi:DNA-binding response OmpR family regulator
VDYKTLFSQTKNMSILLVEDYKPLRDDMAEMLDDLFGTIAIASEGCEALVLYQKYYSTNNKGFDLIVTDIQMPVMNGIELIEAVRDINTDQKIIVLSAHTDSDYLLRLINLGIAQFITKPVKHEDLMGTLYHVSKKINSIDLKPQNILMIDLGGNYIWDKEKRLLKQDNNTVELTRHELLLMQLFVEKSEQVCTNDDIIQDFYKNGIDVSESSIRNLIFKLRKKLPDSVIISIYGMGYKFTPLP